MQQENYVWNRILMLLYGRQDYQFSKYRLVLSKQTLDNSVCSQFCPLPKTNYLCFPNQSDSYFLSNILTALWVAADMRENIFYFGYCYLGWWSRASSTKENWGRTISPKRFVSNLRTFTSLRRFQAWLLIWWLIGLVQPFSPALPWLRDVLQMVCRCAMGIWGGSL